MEKACSAFEKISQAYTSSPRTPHYLGRYLEYLITWHKFDFDCIVIGQSPYPAPIHSTPAAALSYCHTLVSEEPPSVYELSRFLANGDSDLQASLTHCLRDSWRMIYGGVLFLNHNLMSVPNPALQHSQCIDQIRYVSDLLVDRAQSSRSNGRLPEIYIVSLGSDGAAAYKELASSISKVYKVKGWKGRHPAYIYRLPERRQLVTPMLPEPARKYLRERLVLAAKRSVAYCDIVIKEGPEYRVIARYDQESGQSLPSNSACGSMHEISRALLPEYPKPILCATEPGEISSLSGAERNDLGIQIQSLRDSMFVDLYLRGVGTSTLDSYAVGALAMSYRNNRPTPPTPTLDADTVGRLVGGFQGMSGSFETVAQNANRVYSALELVASSGVTPSGGSAPAITMPDCKASVDETKDALHALSTACHAACGHMHLFRARMMAAGHHDAISRPRPSAQAELAPSRDITSPSITIPANTSPSPLSPATSPPSVMSSKPAMRKINRSKVVQPSGALQAPPLPRTPQAVAPPSTMSTEPSSITSPKTPTPRMRPINRGLARAPPAAMQSSGLPSQTNPTSEGSSGSPGAAQNLFATPIRATEQEGPQPTSGGTAVVSSGVGPKVRVGDTPFSRADDARPSPSTVEAIQKIALRAPESRLSERKLPEDVAKVVVEWADVHSVFGIGDSVAEYMNTGVVNEGVECVCKVLDGLGESGNVSTIQMALSEDCPPRLKYISDNFRSV